VILLDTSGLLAAMFEDQNHHEACARVLREAEDERIISPFVLAEADYLIQKLVVGQFDVTPVAPQVTARTSSPCRRACRERPDSAESPAQHRPARRTKLRCNRLVPNRSLA
jgi:predicted nucleic acid-binding protein